MIKQAIIPLAGLGTRLLPLTSVIPKELLPINGKPGLEYILDECIKSGIKEVILIISKKKQSIKKYFYNDSFYKKLIKKKKNKKLIAEYKKIKKYKKMIKFVYQNSPRGTGDAVLRCKGLINKIYEIGPIRLNNHREAANKREKYINKLPDYKYRVLVLDCHSNSDFSILITLSHRLSF